MDRHTLEKKIMRMERELLALKTAHERGLGTTRFYTGEVAIQEYPVGSVLVVDIIIDDGESLYPLLIVSFVDYVQASPAYNMISTDGKNYKYRIEVVADRMPVRIISSASFTIRVEVES